MRSDEDRSSFVNSVDPVDRVASQATRDVAQLVERLRREVDGEVRFDDATRALYATDGSNYRQEPIGVVVPRDVDDVRATVAACRAAQVPLLPRGGGTSLAGQCCNVAVIIDMSKYLRDIVTLDPQRRQAHVQPGVVLDALRDAAEQHGLTFAPDPSTHSHNTLGGMIGNNSCGVHSVMGGKTSDNVIELDVLTYDGARFTVGATSDDEFRRIVAAGGRQGEIYAALKTLVDRHADEIRARFPKIPRRVSGYALDELLPENGFHVARALVGTEGTCVTVLGATVRLVPSPRARSLLVLGYPDVFSAGDHVTEVLAHGPIGLEGIDDRLIADMKAIGLHRDDAGLLPDGAGWLLIEFGGDDREQSDARARACMDALRRADHPPSMKLFDDRDEERKIWKVRESGLGATAHVPNKKITWEGWEDAAVPPKRLGPYLRDFRKLLDRYSYSGDLYGHFGQGCVHTRIDFDLETSAGIHTFRHFLDDAADLVVQYGGSLSGEHGDGQSKAALLPKMYGEELVGAFAAFKAIWDPQGRMNPGKVVDPHRPDENLRLGADYAPRQVVTFFKYPKDAGDFGRVALRCVGIGNCRQMHSQTMCPSYRVTREEKHSTRGRARLLFETMRGDVLKGGWREEAMRDALDLCLACKGCKGDCPVHVDMATYKAEFLAHYFKGRGRPREAYAFGLIDRWARLASSVPSLTHVATRTAIGARIAKAMAGMAPQRRIPSIACETFVHWFRHRAPGALGTHEVMLWPDTFNNYFRPVAARAATEVLEAAGFRVRIPPRVMCCGRPLYDFGMLDRAQRYLRRILAELRAEIDAGMEFVVLEPACAAVFRDEMVNLFPGDEVAKRLASQTLFFDEFVDRHVSRFEAFRLAGHAVVHGHCHQKALIGHDAGTLALTRLGVDVDVLDSGCCGMAGSFGFERDKYDLSQQIGELVLFPSIRKTPDDTLIVSDGFSCREQIEQALDRPTMHLAEVLRAASPDRRSWPHP